MALKSETVPATDYQPRIIIVSGPSGVGKGSINSILRKNPDLKIKFSVSMTTRKPRESEKDGVHYFFVDDAHFQQAILNNELIEYAEFVGNYYGTPRRYVEEEISSGNNVILEIEVDGATQAINNEENVLSIFLMPPTLEDLAKRLRGRKSESGDIIKKRLDKALLEVPLKHNYQYVVENDTVNNAVSKIHDILLKERAVPNINNEPIKYDLLRKTMSKIVKQHYKFFVDNWKQNIKSLKDNGLITSADYDSFDAEEKLVTTLTNRLYHRNLAHGNFADLQNEDYVVQQVQRLMFKINFFSIVQKYE